MPDVEIFLNNFFTKPTNEYEHEFQMYQILSTLIAILLDRLGKSEVTRDSSIHRLDEEKDVRMLAEGILRNLRLISMMLSMI